MIKAHGFYTDVKKDLKLSEIIAIYKTANPLTLIIIKMQELIAYFR